MARSVPFPRVRASLVTSVGASSIVVISSVRGAHHLAGSQQRSTNYTRAAQHNYTVAAQLHGSSAAQLHGGSAAQLHGSSAAQITREERSTITLEQLTTHLQRRLSQVFNKN